MKPLIIDHRGMPHDHGVDFSFGISENADLLQSPGRRFGCAGVEVVKTLETAAWDDCRILIGLRHTEDAVYWNRGTFGATPM